MKKIIVAIATLLPILLWNCSNEPEAPAPPSLKMRLLDSVVINKISRQLNTTSDEYPVPWNPADKSTWNQCVYIARNIFSIEVRICTSENIKFFKV